MSDDRHTLAARDLSLGYEGRRVVDGLTLELAPAGITVIVGANASGKSTLLRGLARLLKPTAGVVELDGADISHLPGKRFATLVGLLPQQPIAPDGITVAELVARGRYPHQGWFQRWSTDDDERVAAALAATDAASFADRHVEELSGGQRQRAWIAMALAQDPDILLLDEPTTYLDVTHQIEVLDLLLELNRSSGATVVMVLHDLNLAARYADELVVVASGRIVARGAPAEVLTADLVESAFGLQCRVIPDPVTGTPLVVPLGRFHRAAAEDSDDA